MLPSVEWTRYYRVDGANGAAALHARFVTHRYPRHAHAFDVVGLVESGAQSYWYRGARHVTRAGQVFIVNPGEPHTGEAATASGYVYRTLYLGQSPTFKGAVLSDADLAASLARLHDALARGAPKLEQDSLLLRALALPRDCRRTPTWKACESRKRANCSTGANRSCRRRYRWDTRTKAI